MIVGRQADVKTSRGGGGEEYDPIGRRRCARLSYGDSAFFFRSGPAVRLIAAKFACIAKVTDANRFALVQERERRLAEFVRGRSDR